MQIMCHNKSEHYKQFPSREVDNYRGLTVLTRIHEKYYPSAVTEKLVTQKERDGNDFDKKKESLEFHFY